MTQYVVLLPGDESVWSAASPAEKEAAYARHTVTDGPYAETVEQLTGFYVVESEDLDDLVEVCKILGRGEGAIEIRAAVGSAS